jgi:hypothetical protein
MSTVGYFGGFSMTRAWMAFLVTAALSVFASQASAGTILFQIDDLTDTIHANTYIDGTLVQSVPFGESLVSSYGLWNTGFLQSGFNIHLNIREADGSISDTLSLTGVAASSTFNINFVSDTEGQPLSLIDATSIFETGDWQTVATFNSLNAAGAPLDSYTVQFRSDVETVPEPITLSLFAAGLFGAMATRRHSRKAA